MYQAKRENTGLSMDTEGRHIQIGLEPQLRRQVLYSLRDKALCRFRGLRYIEAYLLGLVAASK
jgi:hypothetical protein